MGAACLYNDTSGLALWTGVDGAQGWVPVPVYHWVMKAAPNDFYPVEDEYMSENFERVDSVSVEADTAPVG